MTAASSCATLSPAASRIVQRRTQMFVHSYLYYVLDQPIVSDHAWQRWADDLALMQRNHPKLAVDFYDDDFADWDGSTGMHLPQYPWVVERGAQLLRLHARPDLRAGHGAHVEEVDDVSVRIERTRQAQMAAARAAGAEAAHAGHRRQPPNYRKRIEIDAWHEGFDAVSPPPVPPVQDTGAQMALF